MRARLTALVLLAVATVLPHAAICERWTPLAGVLHMGLASAVAHVLLHSLFFGALAAALSGFWVCERDSAAPFTPHARAWLALLAFVGIGFVRQAGQAFVSGPRTGAETLFDFGVDGLGGALGLIAWTLSDGARARRVARGLGWLFHPVVVAPLGFFVLCWSHTGSPTLAAGWCVFVTLFELPAVIFWLVGLRHARFSDADISVRHERVPLLVASAASAVMLLAATWAIHAPAVVLTSAVGALMGAFSATAITRWGLKISGHVGVAVAPAVALLPDSPRAAYLFGMIALILVWARVRDERHTPREVLGGVVLAALVAVVSFHARG